MEERKIKQNVAEILVEKNRSGRQGMFKLYFKGECTKFLNYNEENESVEGEMQKQGAPKAKLEGYEDLPEELSKEPVKLFEDFSSNAPFDPDGAPDMDAYDMPVSDSVDDEVFE